MGWAHVKEVRGGRRRDIRAALVCGTVVLVLVGAALAARSALPGRTPGSQVGAAAAAVEQTPPPQAETLWAGDMEEGSLSDWDVDQGGGEFNSGSGGAIASRDFAYDGRWSARLTVTAPPESGTRLFRWKESRDNRELYYQAWFYIPDGYQLTGDAATGRFLNLFQFKSTSQDRRQNDPFWFLNVEIGSDGEMRPELVWWHRAVEGPHQGESGYRTYAGDMALPVDRWFQVRARLRQSKDFDGVVQFWLDGRQIFDLRDVRTGYANCAYNVWCVDQGWSVNLYSDGLTPAPSVIYVDGARIEPVSSVDESR